MYRKKTVLLCPTNSETVKPVGVAGFVSDGLSTHIKINVGRLHKNNGFVVVAEADGNICTKSTNTLVNLNLTLKNCLLERAFCLVLDSKDMTPLLFGSSQGYFLTTEILNNIKNKIFADKTQQSTEVKKADTTVATDQIHSDAFLEVVTATDTAQSKTDEVEKPYQTENVTENENIATKETAKTTAIENNVKIENIESAEEKTTKKVTEKEKVATAEAETTEKKDNIAIQSESTTQDNNEQNKQVSQATQYEQFVYESPNYYEGTQLRFDQESKAKVSLADYAEALQRFYNGQDKKGYYQSVKQELQSIFDSYLPYEPLMKVFDGSYFVKISDKKGRFFALGLLTDGQQPTYICYALPKKEKGFDSDGNNFEEKTIEEQDKQINFCFVLQSADDGKLMQTAA